MEAMALWTPKVEVSKASGGPSVGASTGLWSGHLQPGDLMGGGTGAPPSLGISARSLLPWPHFHTRDHREEDQTGRYRDRLETQQEMGVGGSEREAVDY